MMSEPTLAAPAMALHPPNNDSMDDDSNAVRIHAESTPDAIDSALTTPTSSDGGGGGKAPRKYERKSKRFVWPEDLHRLFVAAIFDLGLKNASPKTLLPFMGPAAANAGITTEHLKSRLQKYRLNYERSRQEFLRFYDEAARASQRRRMRNPANSADGGEYNPMGMFPVRPKQTFSIRAGLPPHLHTSHSVTSSGGDGDMSEMDQDAAMEATPSAYAAVPPTSMGMNMNMGMDMGGAAGYPPDHAAPMPFNPAQPPRPVDAGSADLMMLAQQYAAAAAALGYPFTGNQQGPNGQIMGNAAMQWPLVASLLSSQLAAQQQQQQAMQTAGLPADQAMPPNNISQIQQAMQANMSLHRQMLSQLNVVSQNALGTGAATPDRSFTANLNDSTDWRAQQQQYMAQMQAAQMQAAAMAGMDATGRPRTATDPHGVMDFLSATPTAAADGAALDLYQGDSMDMDLSDDDGDLFDFLRT